VQDDRATIFLTQAEAGQLFGGLRRADAQRRFLDAQGIRYVVNAKGQPLVLRESLLLGKAIHARPAPDQNALQNFFARRARR
jgi:hypothetical protein